MAIEGTPKYPELAGAWTVPSGTVQGGASGGMTFELPVANISRGGPFGGAPHFGLGLGRAIRPNQIVETKPPNVVVPRRILPGEDTEAFISWGAKSNFALNDQPTEPQIGGTGLQLKNKNKRKNQDDPEGPEVIVMSELQRETEEVRVENPDDADQYVKVQRIKKIWFQSEKTGIIYRYDLKPPAGN